MNEPNWKPLEKVLPLDQCADWMWMYARTDGDRVIQHYKHRDTRGYLYLDQDGQAWTFDVATRGCYSSFVCDIDHEHTDDTHTARRISLAEAIEQAGL
ncbi:hypothetical protein [Plantactinospora sp. WMMB782]|uniref:hypothetical protein n=1 Tax=Plantactinospora sp. WMMB782 TaxID=3404121 RepID=UPI003B943F88